MLELRAPGQFLSLTHNSLKQISNVLLDPQTNPTVSCGGKSGGDLRSNRCEDMAAGGRAAELWQTFCRARKIQNGRACQTNTSISFSETRPYLRHPELKMEFETSTSPSRISQVLSTSIIDIVKAHATRRRLLTTVLF